MNHTQQSMENWFIEMMDMSKKLAQLPLNLFMQNWSIFLNAFKAKKTEVDGEQASRALKIADFIESAVENSGDAILLENPF